MSDNLVQDFLADSLAEPVADRAFGNLVTRGEPNYIDYRSWQRIDKAETARGHGARRPRIRFVGVAELLSASADLWPARGHPSGPHCNGSSLCSWLGDRAPPSRHTSLSLYMIFATCTHAGHVYAR